MSVEKASSRMRGVARLVPTTIPPMEAGLLLLMIVLAVAGSL